MVFDAAVEAVQLFYFVVDLCKTAKRRKKGSPSIDKLCAEYNKHTGNAFLAPADVAALFHKHHEFLMRQMNEGAEGVKWHKTLVYAYLCEHHPELARPLDSFRKRPPKLPRPPKGVTAAAAATATLSTPPQQQQQQRQQQAAIGLDVYPPMLLPPSTLSLPPPGPVNPTVLTSSPAPALAFALDGSDGDVESGAQSPPGPTRAQGKTHKSVLRPAKGGRGSGKGNGKTGKAEQRRKRGPADDGSAESRPGSDVDSASSDASEGGRATARADGTADAGAGRAALPALTVRPRPRKRSRLAISTTTSSDGPYYSHDYDHDPPSTMTGTSTTSGDPDESKGEEEDASSSSSSSSSSDEDDTFLAAHLPPDTWVCPVDGCPKLVYRASLKHAKELIADHSLSHARETEDLLDLVLSEQRRNMSVNVTHLLGRIRRLTRDETSFEDVMNQPIFGTEVDAGVEGDGGRPSELALASAAIMPAPGDHSLLGHDHDHDHDHDRQDITLDPMSEFAASFAEQHDFVAAGHDEEDGPMGVDELLEEPPLDTTATAAAAAATTPAAAHPFLEQQEPPVVKRWPGLDQCVL